MLVETEPAKGGSGLGYLFIYLGFAIFQIFFCYFMKKWSKVKVGRAHLEEEQERE